MIARLLPILALLLLGGCASYPKPDPSLIAWDRPNAEAEAQALAKAINGGVWRVTGVSMTPFIEPDDYLVGDFTQLFDWIAPGWIALYDPNWADASMPFVAHMAVEKTSDAWVMTGISNDFSEAGARAMTRGDYRARVVQIFTSRKKP